MIINKKETSVLVVEKIRRHGGEKILAASIKTVGEGCGWQKYWLSYNLEKS